MPNKLDEKELNPLKGVDFKKLAKNEKSPRIRIRLYALMHMQQGKSVNNVAEIFGVTWKTAKSWLCKYNQAGLEGLADKPRSGRTPYLKHKDVEKFKAAIEGLQAKKKGGRIIGKDIQKLLYKQFRAEYDLDSIYKILKRVGLVWITARSMHPHADIKAQESFKKTLPKK